MKPFKITTLDGRSITLASDELLTPQTVRCMQGEGMPVDGGNGEKGDLYVRFDITLPVDMSLSARQSIIKALKANEQEIA